METAIVDESKRVQRLRYARESQVMSHASGDHFMKKLGSCLTLAIVIFTKILLFGMRGLFAVAALG